MTLFLALTLAAMFDVSEAAPPSGNAESPGPEAASSPELVGSPPSPASPLPSDVEPPPPAPREQSTARKVALTAAGIALVEGMFALYSAGAAAKPEVAGWTLVALSPIAAGSGSGDHAAFGVGLAAGAAGLGLYNALELRSSTYTKTERFWLNMAGWHAAVACGALADRIARPRSAIRTNVAIVVGGRGTPSMLLVASRF